MSDPGEGADSGKGRGPRPAPARSWLRRGVEWGLTLVVTVFIFRRIGLDLSSLGEMDGAGLQVSVLPLAGSIVVLAAGYVVSAGLWGRMVREMGGPALPLRVAVPVFMVANLGRYVPGKVVQIAGLTWLARNRGVDGAVAAGAAILGQGVALLGATVVGLAAFFSPALDDRFRVWGWLGLAAIALFVAAAGVPTFADRVRSTWFRVARSAPPTSELPTGIGFGLRWIGLYTLNWTVYALAFWLFFLGIVGWQPFLFVAPAFAAAYVGGYLALFAPAGLGVREGLLAAFLSPVLDPQTGLTVAVAARLWTTVVEVAPAGLMARGVLTRDGVQEVSSGSAGAHEGPEVHDEGRS